MDTAADQDLQRTHFKQCHSMSFFFSAIARNPTYCCFNSGPTSGQRHRRWAGVVTYSSFPGPSYNPAQPDFVSLSLIHGRHDSISLLPAAFIVHGFPSQTEQGDCPTLAQISTIEGDAG